MLTEEQKEIALRMAREKRIAINDDEAIELVEAVIAALPKPEPVAALKELGKRLAARLDEDDWNYIEPFLSECETSDNAARIKELEAEVDLINQQWVCDATNKEHHIGMLQVEVDELTEKLRVAREALEALVSINYIRDAMIGPLKDAVLKADEALATIGATK